MVRKDSMDGLCTYPSENRKKYLNFSDEYLFVQDLGYLVYNKKKPGIERLTEVTSYDDLARFEFVGVNGVGWEVDNIPQNIRRELVPKLTTAFKLLFRRQSGDFMVGSIEQAVRFARSLGIDTDDIGFVRADFITNHLVPYHIGLRKNLSGSVEIATQITDVIRSAEIRKQRAAVVAEYRL
jgi:polar amino acid transport system substrate-binding protein